MPEDLDRVTSTDYLLFDPSGLVGYWPLNEGAGNTAHDQSGNGDNGTSATIGWSTSCKSGPSCIIAASGNAQINIPFASQLALNKNFTIANWIMVNTSIPASSWPISFGNSGHAGYAIESVSGGTAWMFSYATNYPTCDYSTYTAQYFPSLGTGTWHYLTVTYDGTNINLYLDGALYSSAGGPGSGMMCAASSTDTFYIGGAPVSPGSFSVSDARLYNRVLSAQEIQAIYAGGL